MEQPTMTLLYIHRGKLQTEVVSIWDITRRAQTLYGCCHTTIYRTVPENGEIHEWLPAMYWTIKYTVQVPEEIRLAAMLVN